MITIHRSLLIMCSLLCFSAFNIGLFHYTWRRSSETIECTNNPVIIVNHSAYKVHEYHRREYPEKILMCAIVKNEEAYIDEWVDYHHALGFDKFFIYDNSAKFEMRSWGEGKGNHVDMKHFPKNQIAQRLAYLDCARRGIVKDRLVENVTYTWAAFFDIDEFLVLRKHENVHEFLSEHLKGGSLGISWTIMETTEDDVLYSPIPVTKRFQYHRKVLPNSRTFKSIVKLSDMYLKLGMEGGIHNFMVRNGTAGGYAAITHDTSGRYWTGFFQPRGEARDVASLYHYHQKSYKEYVEKRMRGSAYTNKYFEQKLNASLAQFDEALKGVPTREKENIARKDDLIFDDSVWKAMKWYVPKYNMFDNF